MAEFNLLDFVIRNYIFVMALAFIFLFPPIMWKNLHKPITYFIRRQMYAKVIIFDLMGGFLFPIKHDYVELQPKDGKYHWKKKAKDYLVLYNEKLIKTDSHKRPVLEYLVDCPVPLTYEGKVMWVDDKGTNNKDFQNAYPNPSRIRAMLKDDTIRKIFDFSYRDKMLIVIIIGLLIIVAIQIIAPYFQPKVIQTITQTPTTTSPPVIKP